MDPNGTIEIVYPNDNHNNNNNNNNIIIIIIIMIIIIKGKKIKKGREGVGREREVRERIFF